MISLEVINIGKRYAINSLDKRKRLKKELLKKLLGLNMNDVNIHYRDAIQEVSFSAMRGESVALIGKNGAGKSTILKLISGAISPDSGQIKVNGQVGGLIELGAGLVITKTGRDNAKERAVLLGIPGDKIERFIEEIDAFSDLGEQFEDPVGTYSSGMKARLGFAIAVSLPFDIMICDEALSVGDADFTAKCLAKVNELKADRIFLFVSHSMSTVQRFCERAVVIDKGCVVYSGKSTDSVAFYENNILNRSVSADTSNKNASLTNNESSRKFIDKLPVKYSFLKPIVHNSEKVVQWDASINCKQGMSIDWEVFLANCSMSQPYRLGFPVYSAEGRVMFGCANENLLDGMGDVSRVTGKLVIPRHCLNPGVYQIVIALYEGMEPILRQHIGDFKVGSCGIPYFGSYNVEHEWVVDVEVQALK